MDKMLAGILTAIVVAGLLFMFKPWLDDWDRRMKALEPRVERGHRGDRDRGRDHYWCYNDRTDRWRRC